LGAEVESETAMALAAELAEDAASITAVLVIEIPPNLPLDCHMLDEEREARRVLEEARVIAERRGVRVRTRLVRAREAGEAIVDEARAAAADVVVLRAPRAGERRRKVFGKTVDYVLKHAPCRVLIAAPAAP
jgi:APA family basic amino acid/polyamine antiporter